MRMRYLVFVLTLSSLAWANDVYLAQTAQGGNTGADCADAFVYSWFNSAGHYSATPSGQSNYGPGTTVHLCGVIAGPNTGGTTGQNILTFQGNGTSGNPITLKFESGAILQAPYAGTGGSALIQLSNLSWITIDGGNTGNATGTNFPTAPATWTSGIIQNYANGSSGQSNCPGVNNTGTGACTFQQNPSVLVQAIGVNNVTIKNLKLGPGAVVTSGAFSGGGAQSVVGLRIQGSNVTITNNQLFYFGDAIDDTSYGNDSNWTISSNYFEENGWGIGLAGGAVTFSNVFIHDNWLHDWDAWSGTGTHLNGIFTFNGSGGQIPVLYLYNNAFYGNTLDNGWTAWGHFGNDSAQPGKSWTNSAGLQAWNNLCVIFANVNNGCFEMNGGTGNNVYNNTFIQTENAGGCALQGGTGGGSGNFNEVVNIQNNVFQGWGEFLCFNNNDGMAGFTASNNIYAHQTGGSAGWQLSPVGNATTLAAWQSACGCDAGSISQAAVLANLSGCNQAGTASCGIPSAGFVGTQWGANLSSISTGNLASLLNDSSLGNNLIPKGRPNSGSCTTQGTSSCWDIGALQVAAPIALVSPTSLTFGTQIVGTNSASQPVTLQNTGNAAMTIASITTSGDYSQSNTCSSTLAVNASCTINVVFSPTATGTRSGTLSISDNAGGSPQTVSLTGTGISPVQTSLQGGTSINGGVTIQ